MASTENDASSSRPEQSNDRCPICLQLFDDQVVLDSCFHAFCRFCILQWAEFEPARRHGKNRCPLCRSHFSVLYSNFDPASQTYNSSFMDEESNTHWSQHYEAQNALKAQQSRTLHGEGAIRRRRALIYAQRLHPIVTFVIPQFPASLHRGHLVVLTKVTQAFSGKSSLFLSREIPILLLHDNMRPGLASYGTQQSEISLLTDLILSSSSTKIVDLVRFVSACCQYDAVKTPIESVLQQPEDLISCMPDSIKDLCTELSPFFGESTPYLLRELMLFCLSPWKLEDYEHRMQYIDAEDAHVDS